MDWAAKNNVVSLCVFLHVTVVCWGSPPLQSDVQANDALPLTPAPAPGVTVLLREASPVKWDGREYVVSEGIDILIKEIMNVDVVAAKRSQALEQLTYVARHLKDSQYVPDLIDCYDTLTDEGHKHRLVGCLFGSQDPRALSLFAKILNTAANEIDRMQAASALAEWNIRCGVNGLLNLLRTLVNNDDRLADAVLRAIQGLNTKKAWGMPTRECARLANESGKVLSENQKLALNAKCIQEWFEENQHRFPDWKPGDPLPEVEADQQNPVEGNDK